ncbi:MAG TPA: phosphate ABC transporter substrate-binding protein [Deltaproteobacteria bacterium]|nr:phosphate ABC transporter substrate-binding protein [Deltaproteobacteria bacterium]
MHTCGYLHMWGAMILSWLLACNSTSTEPLVLAGSSTIRPVVEVIAEAFEAQHPELRIEVQGGGSGVGVASIRSGLAQVGMVSRSLAPDETELQTHTIAYDGIALIVHRDNPTEGTTRPEVVAIYTGELRSWPHGGAITGVNKEEGRSTRELFARHFGLEGRFRSDLVVIGPNGQAIATVAADPAAIAYVSIGSALGAVADGVEVKLLSLDGIEPTVGAVASGRYPLSRELNLVTTSEPSGAAADFIAFVRSPEGQRLVAAENFVPIADAAAP